MTTEIEMSSSRPYLVRAVNDWIVDNGLTPQVVVDAEREGVAVPRQFVEEGRIVLNISPSAVRGLAIDNDSLAFSARFSGNPFQVFIPMRAVVAILARENGAGMSFPEEPDGEDDPPPTREKPRPALKVVK